MLLREGLRCGSHTSHEGALDSKGREEALQVASEPEWHRLWRLEVALSVVHGVKVHLQYLAAVLGEKDLLRLAAADVEDGGGERGEGHLRKELFLEHPQVLRRQDLDHEVLEDGVYHVVAGDDVAVGAQAEIPHLLGRHVAQERLVERLLEKIDGHIRLAPVASMVHIVSFPVGAVRSLFLQQPNLRPHGQHHRGVEEQVPAAGLHVLEKQPVEVAHELDHALVGARGGRETGLHQVELLLAVGPHHADAAVRAAVAAHDVHVSA
mmetsp:Transcript_47207/g.90104  ORF Transcript_47207/g.90104 Transcript_47207/m.90104 type:complete len:265 (-) Transcript_47207:2804-3598(-)